MKSTKHCRACKSADMLQVEYAQDINVKGIDVHVSGLLAWECPACQAQIETAMQLDHNSALVRAAFLASRAEYKRLNKLLTGEEIRNFRNSFALTQKEAASLFGGGPSAFSKYEAEDVVHSASMDKLLRLCKKYPQNIARLAAQAGIQLRAETQKKIREDSSLIVSQDAPNWSKKIENLTVIKGGKSINTTGASMLNKPEHAYRTGDANTQRRAA